ncbi:MAG: class I SAM-dependent methyltransferase [Bacteroidetes bacterium]|nr:MAG: class I SAM-dependent methyltransferase [Bacteroidota bacterium]
MIQQDAVRKFPFKELDQEGLETLQTISAAHHFNRWMHDTVEKELREGTVLEVGSGIGNISRMFLDAGWKTCLSDIRDSYLTHLESTYAGHPSLIDILQVDLVHPDFENAYGAWLEKFDNIFALNVIEHIENDTLAIANCKKLLRPGGRLVILVPAHQLLYNRFDEELFHYRRYNRKSLKRLFEVNGLRIRSSFYFNLAGIFGWWFSGTLLRKKTIPQGQMKLYNQLVPLFRVSDRLTLRQLGLSVVVAGEK